MNKILFIAFIFMFFSCNDNHGQTTFDRQIYALEFLRHDFIVKQQTFFLANNELTNYNCKQGQYQFFAYKSKGDVILLAIPEIDLQAKAFLCTQNQPSPYLFHTIKDENDYRKIIEMGPEVRNMQGWTTN